MRDANELMSIFLRDTPDWVIGIMLLLPLLYGLFLGIEVISRASEIYFPYIILSGILMIVLVFFSDIVKLENFQPVLEPAG